MSKKNRNEAILELPLLGYDLYEVNRVAASIVGRPGQNESDVEFRENPTLAFICDDGSRPKITLHPLFNVEWLPREILLHVLIHEHLHLVVEPIELSSGEIQSHPPEFWEIESQLSPNSATVWWWIYKVWGPVLTKDTKTECIWVKSSWKRLRYVRYQEELITGVSPVHQFPTWDDAVRSVAQLKPGEDIGEPCRLPGPAGHRLN